VFRRLLLLNGLAAIAVPIHHAAAYGLLAMFQWTDRYRPVTVPNYDQLGSPAYYMFILLRLLMSFAVPAFLFISGFYIAFMARGNQGTIKWGMVTPRIKILVIPFILWTLFRYAMLRHVPTSLDDLFDPYHYIPLLFQFYLLSPLIVPLAKKRWKLLLSVAALYQLAILGLRYLSIFGLDIFGQFQILKLLPRWFFLGNQTIWFPFGVVAGLHLPKFSQRLAQLKWYLLIAVLMFGFLSMVEYELIDRFVGEEWIGPTFGGITRILYAGAFILFILAFDGIPSLISKKISELSPKSLGIYMANIPAIYVIALMLYKLMPWALGYHFLYWGLLFTAGLAGPLLLMELVRRTPARKGYRYFFG
jgi:surface polysaccharide O-acyltransferase-like enzyme